MSLAAGERKKEMVQIECRWVECSRRWRLQQKTSIVKKVSVCLCVCVCVCPWSYLRDYTNDLHQIFVRVTYGRGSVLLWRRSDTLRISGFIDDVIFAQKLRLLDIAASLRQWGSHAALNLARRNIRCRQRKLSTTSCSQGLIDHSGLVGFIASWVHVCT